MKIKNLETDEEPIEEINIPSDEEKRKERPFHRKERKIGVFGTSLSEVFKKEGLKVNDGKQERRSSRDRRKGNPKKKDHEHGEGNRKPQDESAAVRKPKKENSSRKERGRAGQDGKRN